MFYIIIVMSETFGKFWNTPSCVSDYVWAAHEKWYFEFLSTWRETVVKSRSSSEKTGLDDGFFYVSLVW